MNTKFDIGDYVYIKEDEQWYLVKICRIIITKRNESEFSILYDCEWCEINGITPYWAKYGAVIDESNLYKEKL